MKILAEGQITAHGVLAVIPIHYSFIGKMIVRAQGGGHSYMSLREYLVVGRGQGNSTAQVQQIGELVGHFDAPARVDVVLEPDPNTPHAVRVVANSASSAGGMTYKVLFETY